ncbi:MAG: HAMP domain-containing histidine kinase [Firmicutes bacterium]|nr:HAMP domain-containing histidine kinase [Bacillota bacterium]
MKEKNKKRVRIKLPLKIIMLLFVILAIVIIVLQIILAIVRAVMSRPIINPDAPDRWLFFSPIVIGIIIMTLFALAINRLVVTRIRKLNNATKEVAKGNFDITIEQKGRDELSELTESFNKMSAELKANEYLSKDFVRNVSHEFKTPISAIRAYGELLDAEADAPKIDRKTLKEYAEIIVKESDRLTAMSKSILQLSLLDSTTIIKKDDRVKPAEQIRDILRLYEVKWSDKNLTLDLQLDEVTITSNEQLLYQVWQNLIGNALKFSNNGGTLKISVEGSGQGVIFKITDNGIGISDEDKEQIFSQFFMADKSHNTEGSGLGLPIVKKIIDKLCGQIYVESTVGQGTKFTVILN